ncbi:hypothetical protein [Actinoplanes auranticolor]|uniref:hypothetical protein n=1 Tax=Actinoplanes auranticolor TaxID=47988 RepID=UPI001BB447B8|nr:hypothetical protein [Actinoplanes auranticolor]
MTAGDAVDRHIVFGELVDADAVVVPGPLDWLRDPAIDFEVLIASSRRGGPGHVERVRVRQAEVIGVDSGPEGACAVLRLERAAAHRPYAGGRFDGDRLRTELEGYPDVWRGLCAIGAVRTELTDLDKDRVLRPVADWEAARRAALVRERLVSPAEVAQLKCCIFVICWWCQECRGDWWD